mgnify:CR=1 FL=1
MQGLGRFGGIARVFAAALAFGSTPAVACGEADLAMGVQRIVQIDASAGPVFGTIGRYTHEPSFLEPKEIVLTFDDGPAPRITRSILATLERFCVKATFFPVGRMAIAYPEVVREIARGGHTIGAHTWSHPSNLRRYRTKSATAQVEKGFAAIAKAAGAPIAPFFRFPGLNDDGEVIEYLQSRSIATFSVDVVSDDSFTDDPAKLTEQVIARTIERGGGIVLFHDIKPVTALALPGILNRLKKHGFKVVHLTSKHTIAPSGDFDEELDRRFLTATKGRPLPATPPPAEVHPVIGAFAIARPPVTELAPIARAVERASVHKASLHKAAADAGKRPPGLRGTVTGWATTIDRRGLPSTAARPD